MMNQQTKDKDYPDLPRVAVGAVVFKDSKVLLVRRAKAPAQGLWAIPGGSVELGETLQQAAEREILEETGIKILAKKPACTFDLIEKDNNNDIRFHYVIVDLVADYVSGEPVPGDDADEVRWVSSGELNKLNVNQRTLNVLNSVFGFIPGGHNSSGSIE
jgi:8-oxo-dGTP diphosphatase